MIEDDNSVELVLLGQIQYFQTFVIIIFLTHFQIFNWLTAMFINAFQFVLFLSHYIYVKYDSDERLVAFSHILMTLYLMIILHYNQRKASQYDRNNFFLSRLREKENQNINDTLSLLLPKFVKDYLQQGDGETQMQQH